MNKPLGVIVSAVCALLGSLFTLAIFVLLFLSLVVFPGHSPVPGEARVGVALGLAMFGLLGTWGTTTAIGLLRLRNWARISIIIFATFLALTGVAAAPTILLMPAPATAPPNFTGVRTAMAVFYAALGLLGALWLYYFSRRPTREAFDGAVVAESGGRPLSISIIGWWLLIAGVLGMLASPLRMPVNVFIWIVTGWSAAIWYLLFGAVYAYAGYGLLRLNPTARMVAIGALCFGTANGFVFFLFPGGDERLATFMSRFRFGLQTPPLTHFPAFMFIPMALGIALPLWFLITRKQAFQAPV